ncbi:polysaccharide pyruvyl transferase family protein [Ciceribacter sp. RN22]|uniref:polysaccharide pyruvyl transferase family protein n=1 Tax=Ciceribacter sp. RN22 TaxID=2954932 RepID=UPI0020937321|nr:polysaccharide pyruvyl transferase family protein [Ciceribacter sp. RN22]MCO6178865.1 polysaccharide pyruvyl transferase family protein [Ciceribacter sp. RN22]
MRLTRRPIRLFFSRRRNGATNFGDDISPILVSHITGREVHHATVSRCDWAAIGSIIEMIAERRIKRVLHGRFLPIQIWGSGCLRGGDNISRIFTNVLAVRGEHTRERLACPRDLPLGDPGLLFNRLHQPASTKRYKWGITAHYTDADSPLLKKIVEQTPNSLLIPLDIDPMDTLRLIGECEHIASSSLHGLVAADSFGIPNWRIALGDRIAGGNYKFEDYASAIGRTAPQRRHLDQSGNLDLLLNEGYPDFSYMQSIEEIAGRLEKVLLSAAV